MKKFIKEWAESEKRNAQISIPLLLFGALLMVLGDIVWSPLMVVGQLVIIATILIFTIWWLP